MNVNVEEAFSLVWKATVRPLVSVAPDGRGVGGESGMDAGTLRSCYYDYNR